ncbi:MAG: FdtA/QdtA family cupin domain-containing protein [Lachnospiraceae bacterium]|jgi:dTDP-4-dehydrorhamnose 3,5-epimerase-like enzyme|nr:FdtA/QdtA family cupin domain-containing protein [Lachnospiraceae bacterium]
MNTINDIKVILFPQVGDERGSLVIVEGGKDIPFDIKRVFYIYGSDANVVRGQHANRATDFMLINVSGTSKVKIIDGNNVAYVVHLDKPHYGIYLPHMLWKDMYDFSPDSVLLALASTNYDPGDYIRDFDEFLRLAGAEIEAAKK